MNKPSVGRHVHFFNAKDLTLGTVHSREEPCAAIITYVWGQTCVNLIVFDHNAVPHQATSVRLLPSDEPKPESGQYCTWPPR
jgi:hypothetical protein